MKVKLKVIGGKSAGKELPVQHDEFVIGRQEGVQLRIPNDAISRKHCRIKKTQGAVTAANLGSRNGTSINGKKISGEQELKPGDKLSVGPFEFEVLIEYELGGAKQPKVQGIKDAVARTAQKSGDSEADVMGWLDEPDEEDEGMETQRFSIDDIKVVRSEPTEDKKSGDGKKSGDKKSGDKAKKGEKAYGKLPTKEAVAGEAPKDTRDAANDMLKKMFKK